MNFKAKAKSLYKRIIFAMSAGNNFIFTAFYRYLFKPKKDTIDEFTSLFSKNRNNLTVVQVGANDGINNDPIHKFIKRDHWCGVLLEPQKYVYKKYLEPLYKNTPGINVLNAALDTNDGHKPIYKISVSNSRWATGLTSFNRAVLEEAVRSGYVERQAAKEGAGLPLNKDECIIEESVECISTASLLRKFSLKKIDWLQIDTEGFDFEIIKMFNIASTKPEVIVYENIHFSDELRNECNEYLKQNGYITRNYGPNTLAMRLPAVGFQDFFQDLINS
jgi:FkbM family methyltransferase